MALLLWMDGFCWIKDIRVLFVGRMIVGCTLDALMIGIKIGCVAENGELTWLVIGCEAKDGQKE